MTGSSVLPVTIHKGKLYFLFGKENEMEDSAKGYSDFGGGVEPGEAILDTAFREGGEELTGFLGNGKDLRKHIKSHGGIMKIITKTYHTHLFYLPYDENLPKYYNANHIFLWERMDKNVLSKTKLFEKIEIDWFSTSDMKRRMREFRPFYQENVREFLKKKGQIRAFIKKCMNKTRKRTHHVRSRNRRSKKNIS